MIEYTENNEMVYEGDYEGSPEDGFVREGKGKEYYTSENGSLLYEGDWKNDKRNGEGNYYNIEGSLVYEGHWSDGRPNGKGKTYNRTGKSENDGFWSTGYYTRKPNVLIRYDDADGYAGQWNNDKPHGKGKYVNKEGKVYEGEWDNGFFQIDKYKWFNYSTRKIAFFHIEKDRLPEWLYRWLSIEVKDEETSNQIIRNFYCILLAILVAFVAIVAGILWGVYHNSHQCDIIRSINNALTELVIPDNQCVTTTVFDISRFKQLKSIDIGRNNFKNVNSVVIKSTIIDN